MPSSNITSENEIAQAVVDILATTTSGEATLAYLRKRIPNRVQLTSDDMIQSQTRPREALWEQRLRNIKSHHNSPGNYIAEGWLVAPSRGRLRITPQGRNKAH